jgi:voltage-gated potassium channel
MEEGAMTSVRWLRLAAILVLILVVYFVAPVDTSAHWENFVRGMVSLLVFAGLAIGMVYQLRMHIDDTSRRVDGLIVGIVLVVVVFSHAFYVMQKQDPSAFVGLETRLDSLYFATTTLVTVGTGDVHAAGQSARALVLVQMVFNVVFVASTATLLTSRIRDAAVVRAQQKRPHPHPDES